MKNELAMRLFSRRSLTESVAREQITALSDFGGGLMRPDKSAHFLAWAETVFGAAKKSLKRVPSLDAYLGEDAERWRSKGGVFVAVAIKGKPPILA